MAILDKLTEFGDAFDITESAGTYNLTNQIDTGSVVRDLGAGEPLYLIISVATGIKVASSTGTLQFKLVSDASADIATDGSASVHFATAAFATSSTAIAAGTVLACVPLPMAGATAYERYLGVQAVVGTTAISEGAVDAYLSPTPVGGYKSYPDATN